MSNFHDLAQKRHSIRKYTDEAISADDVKTILEAALMAPSSKRSTPWEFVVIEDKEKLNAIAGCREFGTLPLTRAALAVLVCVNPETSHAWVEDGAIAATFMQLQAEDLGLGSCWIHVRERFTKDNEPSQDYIRSIVDIPEELQILCAVVFGHKAEEKSPFDLEKLQWEKVHIVK